MMDRDEEQEAIDDETRYIMDAIGEALPHARYPGSPISTVALIRALTKLLAVSFDHVSSSNLGDREMSMLCNAIDDSAIEWLTKYKESVGMN